MPLNVIVLGPPGAGKGTQAERIARRHGIPRISTGDILRAAIHQDSPLGRSVKEMMQAGGLVDDTLIVALVKERLDQPDAKDGFVLDGFPRTAEQAHALDNLMIGRGPLVVLNLLVTPQEVVRRLSSRRVCVECGFTLSDADQQHARCPECGGTLIRRSDDNPEVIQARLQVFAEQQQRLVHHYERRPGFSCVDGNLPPEQVAEALESVIRQASLHRRPATARPPVDADAAPSGTPQVGV